MIHRQSWHDGLASTFLRLPRDLAQLCRSAYQIREAGKMCAWLSAAVFATFAELGSFRRKN